MVLEAEPLRQLAGDVGVGESLVTEGAEHQAIGEALGDGHRQEQTGVLAAGEVDQVLVEGEGQEGVQAVGQLLADQLDQLVLRQSAALCREGNQGRGRWWKTTPHWEISTLVPGSRMRTPVKPVRWSRL